MRTDAFARSKLGGRTEGGREGEGGVGIGAGGGVEQEDVSGVANLGGRGAGK